MLVVPKTEEEMVKQIEDIICKSSVKRDSSIELVRAMMGNWNECVGCDTLHDDNDDFYEVKYEELDKNTKDVLNYCGVVVNDDDDDDYDDSKAGYIYVYSDYDRYHYRIKHGDVPYLKVGYTTKDPSVRIKQQDKTSNSCELIELCRFEVKGITDKRIHKALESMGCKRLRRNREWFAATINQVSKAVEDYLYIGPLFRA